MRRCLLFVILIVASACSGKPPTPPDPQAYKAMTEEQKCAATAPRATRCVDELMIAHLRQLMGSDADGAELARAFADDVNEKRSSADQADAMHRTNCVGSRGTLYQDAVIACWNTTPCEAFAKCVADAEARR
ncbi:hypothetical protein BH11MYX3_BH11MYX3_34050 [soil metagenome]